MANTYTPPTPDGNEVHLTAVTGLGEPGRAQYFTDSMEVLPISWLQQVAVLHEFTALVLSRIVTRIHEVLATAEFSGMID